MKLSVPRELLLELKKALLRESEDKEKERRLKILQLEAEKDQTKKLEIKANEVDKTPTVAEVKPKVLLPISDSNILSIFNFL